MLIQIFARLLILAALILLFGCDRSHDETQFRREITGIGVDRLYIQHKQTLFIVENKRIIAEFINSFTSSTNISSREFGEVTTKRILKSGRDSVGGDYVEFSVFFVDGHHIKYPARFFSFGIDFDLSYQGPLDDRYSVPVLFSETSVYWPLLFKELKAASSAYRGYHVNISTNSAIILTPLL